MNYKLGEHITSENGKLKIKNDKKHLITLARKEIKEWKSAHDKAEDEIKKWQEFIEDINKKI